MMKSVDEASSSNKSNVTKYACAAAVLVAFFFVLSMGGNGGSGAASDNLRSGQAKRPTHHQSAKELLDKKMAAGDGSDAKAQSSTSQSDSVDSIVDKAKDDLKNAEDSELRIVESDISAEVSKAIKKIRENLDTLFKENDDFESEDLDIIANRIEEKLNDNIQATLSEKAEKVVEEETDEIQRTADADTEGGGTEEDLEVDVKEVEETAIDDIKEKIDTTSVQLLASIPDLAFTLFQEYMVTVLANKYKHTFVMKVDAETKTITGYERKSSDSSTTTAEESPSTHSSSTHSSGHHHSSSTHSSSHHSTSGHHSSSSHHHHSSSHHKTSEGEKDAE